jgi:hypothetical protein
VAPGRCDLPERLGSGSWRFLISPLVAKPRRIAVLLYTPPLYTPPKPSLSTISVRIVTGADLARPSLTPAERNRNGADLFAGIAILKNPTLMQAALLSGGSPSGITRDRKDRGLVPAKPRKPADEVLVKIFTLASSVERARFIKTVGPENFSALVLAAHFNARR